MNPNSPENLLLPWLEAMDDYAMGCRVYEKPLSGFAQSLLAHLLEFSDQHKKLSQMLMWLGTDEAKSFFSSASSHSQAVYDEFKVLSGYAFMADLDDPEFMADYEDYAREWIEEFSQKLPATLELK